MSYDDRAISALHEHLLAQAQTTTARERGTHTVVTDGQDAVPRRAWSSANNPRT